MKTQFVLNPPFNKDLNQIDVKSSLNLIKIADQNVITIKNTAAAASRQEQRFG